jgi:hypothetical protein
MKDLDTILGRVRKLLVEELDRRIREASQRRPHYCVYNHRQPLDARKEVYGEPNDYNRISDGQGQAVGQTLGLCMLGAEDPEQWRGTICEDDLDAQRCPYFTPMKDKATVWSEFQRDLSDPDWITSNLPAVSELLWACDEVPCPSLPWWKRLWYRWVLKITVVSPLAVSDPALLPPGPDAPALPRSEASDEGVGS